MVAPDLSSLKIILSSGVMVSGSQGTSRPPRHDGSGRDGIVGREYGNSDRGKGVPPKTATFRQMKMSKFSTTMTSGNWI